MAGSDDFDPASVGEGDAPPVEERPYKVLFEANLCFGAGKCAAASEHWTLDLQSGVARPRGYFLTEAEVESTLRAAEACPAKNGDGVIHVVDRRTGEELAPDPHGDGTVSVDW
ncbi:MAG: ferredoxin [Halobacterium sp.]